ncbi:alpha,alpha-trehalase [Pseudoalteromonas luteoviolacea]|uniref:trehalase family glycosidase n=1 Tax=Pseudoalteromonas luteoviolacea TaxID=43657 RepID=UPI001B37B059|nr:trehalase family glycosidase [Pseudoalteromonas luteoviolacea]MBQ4810776.1 alpha,alpha-trehalase [Pseudoalteromonas luteoviolacea]
MKFEHSRLFKEVQLSGIFADSKTFADAIPLHSWQEVCELYDLEQPQDLEAFVQSHFKFRPQPELEALPDLNSVPEYINLLWHRLLREPEQQDSSSLLALPERYIVPGGRFNEIYYWDSYFTALGLMDCGRDDLVQNMLTNFCFLIKELGHVPNGNRSYYGTRSQPPVTALMIDLLWESNKSDHEWLNTVTKALVSEYEFWMSGKDSLSSELESHRRVVRMPCGGVLNRYWDDEAVARPESYKEDTSDAAELADEEQKFSFYRHIRAACESGWDFSSRWLENADDLNSIMTTAIVPVDLNCLMYFMECQLSHCYDALGVTTLRDSFQNKAKRRAKLIEQYMWQPNSSWYFDYNFEKQRQTTVESMAGFTPMFFELADISNAKDMTARLMSEFLKSGGLVTTLCSTAQQWDSPNGWAPLQWFGVKGLLNYGYHVEANKVAQKWVNTVENTFSHTGCLLEKYNVVDPSKIAKGGEYLVQQGFGWTNGVVSRFYKLLQLA